MYLLNLILFFIKLFILTLTSLYPLFLYSLSFHCFSVHGTIILSPDHLLRSFSLPLVNFSFTHCNFLPREREKRNCAFFLVSPCVLTGYASLPVGASSLYPPYLSLSGLSPSAAPLGGVSFLPQSSMHGSGTTTTLTAFVTTKLHFSPSHKTHPRTHPPIHITHAHTPHAQRTRVRSTYPNTKGAERSRGRVRERMDT